MKDWNSLISPAVQSIPPSGIRRFFDIAAEMDDVISLGVGEPDFVTPWTIRESCVYGLEQGYTSYTANRGMPELRREIARLQKERYGIDYDEATDILVTVGVSEALDLAMRALLSPGDEVLIPEPCYVAYKACATLAGGVAVPVPAKIENEFRITPADLEAHLTPRTKALLIGYPNNPTGAVMGRDEFFRHAATAAGLEPDKTVVERVAEPTGLSSLLGAKRAWGTSLPLSALGEKVVASASLCGVTAPIAYAGGLSGVCGNS